MFTCEKRHHQYADVQNILLQVNCIEIKKKKKEIKESASLIISEIKMFIYFHHFGNNLLLRERQVAV